MDVLIVGHGIMKENTSRIVPQGFTVSFYGDAGLPIPKGAIGGIAARHLDRKEYYPSYSRLPTHYIGPSVNLEIMDRWERLCDGALTGGKSFVGVHMIHPTAYVDISDLFDALLGKFHDVYAFNLHWSLCRSYAGKISEKGHVYNNNELTIEKMSEKGEPVPDPGINRPILDEDQALKSLIFQELLYPHQTKDKPPKDSNKWGVIGGGNLENKKLTGKTHARQRSY